MLMHQLLEDGANAHPDKIAFRWVDRDKTLTFAEAVAAMERLRRRAASSRRAQGRSRHDLRPQRHGLSAGPVRLLADRRDRRAGQREVRRRARLLLRRPRAERRRSTRTTCSSRCSARPRSAERSGRSSAWTGRSRARKACRSCSTAELRCRRPIRATRTPSRICPTRPAPPASRRARAWRTSRRCGRRAASPSGCGSPATTFRSVRPRCRAPISSSATCCRRCIAARPSTSWASWTQTTGFDAIEAHAGDDAGRQSDAAQRTADRSARRAAACPARLRFGMSGGGPVPPTLKRALARRIEAAAGRKLRPERARRLHGARLSRSRCRTTSSARVGRPLPDKEVRILDADGRECCRSARSAKSACAAAS